MVESLGSCLVFDVGDSFHTLDGQIDLVTWRPKRWFQQAPSSSAKAKAKAPWLHTKQIMDIGYRLFHVISKVWLVVLLFVQPI